MPPATPRRRTGTPAAFASARTAFGDVFRRGHEVAALILAEQESVGRDPFGKIDLRADRFDARRHDHLGEGDDDPSSERSCTVSTAPRSISLRTKSPLRFSAARSTGGGA